MDNMIRVGQYDADEFREMQSDKLCQQMIKNERIFLDGEFDKGCIWALEGDSKAYEKACEYAF